MAMFNTCNHPYIASLAYTTLFIATYVEMAVWNVAILYCGSHMNMYVAILYCSHSI